ncbi:MAG: hypothetical protein ACJ71T_15655 [Actinomycetales bacterium]
MDLDEYQRRAQETNQLHQEPFKNTVSAMFGLASESGAILAVYKRFLREKIDLAAHMDYLEEELGDLLWYVSAVASSFDLRLGAVAERNLARTRGFFGATAGDDQEPPTSLDDRFAPVERFPRRLTVRFDEQPSASPTAIMTVVGAEPVDPAWGTVDSDGRRVGFHVGDQLGDPLTDNAIPADGYRYHDALHLAFMAVLGWSPVMRRLLGLKRRSDPATDESEDGARAMFTEEGLAAVLAQLGSRRLRFETETSVDMETIEVARSIVSNLECAGVPPRRWRSAIHQGFAAMHMLERQAGGYLTADLDERRLTYEPLDGEPDMAADPLELAHAIAELHTAKDAAYGNAWKKRGEQMSIMANLARKVDRIENVTQQGGVTTADEDLVDTATDLFVYAVKYRAFLADESATVDRQLFGDDPAGVGVRSDGPVHVNRLILQYGERPQRYEDSDALARSVVADFAALEACFPNGARASVETRLAAATRLADTAWRYALALPAASA